MKKIIVTGGAGFIGSHLVDRLLQEKNEVIVIDNYSRGRPENLEQHKDNKQFTLINDKIEHKEKIDEALLDADALIHFASISSIYRSITESEEINKVNVTGTLNMLDSCIEKDVKRFIFASSSAVYGGNNNHPLKEDECLDPLTPYAASKISGEAYCNAYYKTYGLDTTILRFMNVYGPRTTGTYRRVISKFAEAIINKKPIKIYGDGQQTRDFTYITDTVDAILLVLNSKKVKGETLNIGTGIPTTVNQLANLMIKIANKPKQEIQHISELKNDVIHKVADISKIKNKLGFEPKTSIEEGLQNYFEWFKTDSKLKK